MSVKVAGTQIVYAADEKRGINPFNDIYPGVTVVVVGEFSGSVISAGRATIEQAVSDDGEDLLSLSASNREIFSCQLTSDKTGAILYLKLGMPGEKSKAIKELTGKLVYKVGSKLKDVDVGIEEFKRGAAGTLHGAKITDLGEPYGDGNQRLELELAMASDEVSKVTFLDAEGKTFEAQLAATVPGDNTVTMHFAPPPEGKFPAKGRIVIQTYEDLQVFEAPFTIQNIDLGSRPVK